MKHLFIVNPKAGKGKTLEYIPMIKSYFTNSDEEYTIEITNGAGHATEIAKQYTNQSKWRVYSIGGDGTLNEVLNGIVGSDSSLAIIPSGSGNDFIKSIYPSMDCKNIINATIKGKEIWTDVGKLNDRYFINIASLGIDAEITQNALKIKKTPLIPPKFAYLMSIFLTLFKYKSKNVKLILDEKEIKLNTLLIAIANGKFYGGGMKVAPSADICDGYFDVCHIAHISAIKALFLFPKLIKGKHETISQVTFCKSKKVRISCDYEEYVNIDGEIVKAKDIFLEIVPKAVKIVQP